VLSAQGVKSRAEVPRPDSMDAVLLTLF
jgi:hypothetical protein